MRTPELREQVMIANPQGTAISPDGRWVAFREQTVDWRKNAFLSDVFVVDAAGGTSRRLTRGAALGQMAWIDDDTLAVMRADANGTPQIFVFDALAGEPWQVTEIDGGVFDFLPFGDGILFLHGHEGDDAKTTKNHYGATRHQDLGPRATGLSYVDLTLLRAYERDAAAALDDEEAGKLTRPQIDLTEFLPDGEIVGLHAARNGSALYVNQTPHPGMRWWLEQTSSRLIVDLPALMAAEKDDRAQHVTAEALNTPPMSMVSSVSPDGAQVLISWNTRGDLVSHWLPFVVDADALGKDPADVEKALRRVASDIDESLWQFTWTDAGLFTSYPVSTHAEIAQIPLDGSDAVRIGIGECTEVLGLTASRGGVLSWLGFSPTTLGEVYVAAPGEEPRRLTDYTGASADLDLGTVETITWTTDDGSTVEGVLRKPSNFEEGKRYPLAFVVHGGPTDRDADMLWPGGLKYTYPGPQLLAKGVLILQPNYRGSTGRGEEFLRSNIGHLGSGDLADLVGAIDYLDQQGMIDPTKVACMGWSQGGYISAYAGLRSDRFAAVSVGAGISDWYTYGIQTDVRDFVPGYLNLALTDDRGGFADSSPMAGIATATTPTLIQHGSNDVRVPPSNAMEIYRGLQERNVPVELFFFDGFGHGINKPKESYAKLHQNLVWFSHWLLGEPLEW